MMPRRKVAEPWRCKRQEAARRDAHRFPKAGFGIDPSFLKCLEWNPVLQPEEKPIVGRFANLLQAPPRIQARILEHRPVGPRWEWLRNSRFREARFKVS